MLIRPNNYIDIKLKNNKYPIIYELSITTDLLDRLSDEEVDLNKSFINLSFKSNIIDINTRTSMLISNILKKLISLKEESSEFANSLYIKNMISIVLLLILKSCTFNGLKLKTKKLNHF